jgi:molybdopterin-guanine dinucleotide biosynthesis protein B
MKIFRICGYGGGRGELVARLAGEFSFRQVGIVAVKYAHKPFDMDKPGSETSKLREGGCRQTLIANRERWGLLCETPGQPESEPDPILLAGHLEECDLVLAIGFDNAPLPGLEVLRADRPGEPLCQRDPHIRTVVTDGVPPPGVPFSFTHDDIENIARHILEQAVPLPSRAAVAIR